VNVVALTGESGSGKTTALVALIEHFVAAGRSVGAIKHTHHALNDVDRGDTAAFRKAGAEPVVLAGAGDAVVFSRKGVRGVTFREPSELLATFDTDVVLVEGWKSIDAWPRIELNGLVRQSTQDLLRILDRIWRP
jgi:molybdopterin-guanine dinucleotide biosynthesis adapter protein